jgi:nucleoside-diphosphate-sugar epimerase
MRVLVIGGNRFMGVELVAQLLARGHDVTLLNRGQLGDPFGPLVKRLVADRGTDAFDTALAGTTWDAVFDFVLMDGAQTDRLVRVLEGRVGHVMVISTGQVYLVRTPRPGIARETDYAGPVIPAPTSESDLGQWQYGAEKREVEDRLAASALPFTSLRLPMVHGARDDRRRLDGLLWRLLDGGPILLTQPEAPVRHVFSGAVVRTLVSLLDRGPQRAGFNLAWNEALTARAFVERVAQQLGASPRLVVRPFDELVAAGVDPVQAAFVNSRWMSALDATLANQTLGFVHEPLEAWLPQVVHGFMARWQGPPPSLAQRPLELR